MIHPFFASATGADTSQAFLDALDGATYIVDLHGIIVAVGQPGWDKAAASGAATLPVVGTNLFDQVVGDEVKAACRHIHTAVSQGERPYIAFEYRCDAPNVKRRMRMSVSRLNLPGCAPALLYQSQTLSAVERPWMSLFEPHRIVEQIRHESGLPIIRMCSFCQRVASPAPTLGGTGAWIEAEDYYSEGGSGDVRISHGVCPACSALVADDPVPSRCDGDGRVPQPVG